MKLPGPLWSAALLVALGVGVGTFVTRKDPSASPASACDGEYADSLQALSSRARAIEQSPRAEYTYLIRSSARYECPYFGTDGKLRRRKIETLEHGTAFAYEVSGGETFLLTNEHVASWPEVTDGAHKVEGVPDGCKRLDDRLQIVHDERDDFEPSHIQLQRVATDPHLDAAVLKAGQVLTTLPYRIGKSAGIRQGQAVQVRGFPLGLIQAVNTGKVVNPYDRDQEQGWDHTDFVIDALLSEGNSGSPVLALSCQSGDLQLVGMYHAGYKGHSALNVVVAIDQLREFMLKKRRVPRPAAEVGTTLSAVARKRLRDTLTAGGLPVFEFGGLHVWAELSGEVLLYHVYGRNFPTDDRRLLTIEDKPSGNGFGEVASLWLRGESKPHEWKLADLGAEERDVVVRIIDAVRNHMIRVISYRRALSVQSEPDERRRGREILRTIERHGLPAREMAGSLLDLVERLAPANEAVAAISPDGGARPR